MTKQGYKTCPYCAEEIRVSAIKCRYCKSNLVSGDSKSLSYSTPSSPDKNGDVTGIQQLSQFVPIREIENMMVGSEMMEEGERRNIAILFADLVGFTTLAEILDPEELKDLIDHYLGNLTEIVQKYDGTIGKFIGDAVMALFGAPITHEDDPERALRSALEMQEAIAQLGSRFHHQLQIRVGISSGDVVVGRLGTKNRLDFTAIGDVVNQANRLQTYAQPGQIVVSQRIYQRTSQSFHFQSLGSIQVKGKSEPIHAYILDKPIREYSKLPLRINSIRNFLGREKELALLHNILKKSRKGHGIVIHLTGDAGVGKTRLMYEFRKRRNQLDVRFHYGRCLSYGNHISYLPFVDFLFHGVLGISGTLPKLEAAKLIKIELTRISSDLIPHIPYFLYLLSPDVAPAPVIHETPKARMENIFHSIEKLIIILAKQKPLIIELEDIQWADPLSLQLIQYLMDKVNPLPVMIFLVYRNYYTLPWKINPNTETNKKNNDKKVATSEEITLPLKKLSNRDSKKLIQNLLGFQKIPVGLSEKILEKIEGNPFYTEEVILYLEQTGVLKSTESGWKLIQELKDIEIPDTIQGVVLSRIDRLEARMKRVLQCASVIGYRFRYRILNYIHEVEKDLENHITQLVDTGLVLEETLVPELEYMFRHIVTQEVTYNTLLVRRRLYFHDKIGQCLESIYAGRLDEHYELIAHHYSYSNNHLKALEYLCKAGDKCSTLYANEAAVDFYTQALERVQYHPGTENYKLELEVELRNHRAQVLELTGDIKPALTDHLKNTEIANKIDNPTLLMRAYQNTGELYRQLGMHSQAIEIEKKAIKLSRKNKNIKSELHSSNALAVIYRDLGQYDSALRQFQNILKLSEEQSDLKLVAHAQNNLGITYWAIGKYKEAIQHTQYAIGLREEIGDMKGLVAGYNNIGILYEKTGKLKDALYAYGNSIQLAREIGYKKGEIAGKCNIGWILWLQGERKKALATYRQVLLVSEKTSDLQFQAITLCNMGYVYMFSKDYKKSLDYLNQGLKIAIMSRDTYSQQVVYNGLLELYLRNQKYPQASKIVKNITPFIKENNENENTTTTLRLFAKLALEQGNVVNAEKYSAKANEIAKQTGNLREQAWCILTSGKIAQAKHQTKTAIKWYKQAELIARKLNDIHCLEEIKSLRSGKL